VALDPPLPVYLLRTVAGLREKSQIGFPVKKVSHTLQSSLPWLFVETAMYQLLLVVWKTLLACLGGINDTKRTVDLQRELCGLPPTRRREFGNAVLLT
jgi:hypothetical protein